MKLISYLILVSIVISLCADEQWSLPNDNLRYNQVCFLTAHNAHSSKAEGFSIYYQQLLSIEAQLNYGVRALMLDTFPMNDDVYLCHGSCKMPYAFQKGIDKGFKELIGKDAGYKTLRKTLQVIEQWMVQHPQEIVTIILENYAPTTSIKTIIDEMASLKTMLLTKKDWDPLMHNGLWPTIKWLKQKNKRLIVFDSDDTSEDTGIYYQWFYTIENQYGTFNKDKVCKQRSTSENALSIAQERYSKALAIYQNAQTIYSMSQQERSKQIMESALRNKNNIQKMVNAVKHRKLYVFNYFGTITSTIASANNSYIILKKVINDCADKLAHGKSPNFIALDLISKGNPLKLVNEYNRKAGQTLCKKQPNVCIHDVMMPISVQQ